MRIKPKTLKEVFKELVDSCEDCGSKKISITSFKVFKPKPRKKGFLSIFSEALVPADKDEYKEYLKNQEREKRDGIEIEYHCRSCDGDFLQFYDEETLNAFADFFTKKYED